MRSFVLRCSMSLPCVGVTSGLSSDYVHKIVRHEGQEKACLKLVLCNVETMIKSLIATCMASHRSSS